MTITSLNDYKRLCAEVLEGLPLELCAGGRFDNLTFRVSKSGGDIFTPDAWSEYIIACDLDFDESEPYFDHWWSLPADERLKRAVLNNVRAI